MEHASSIRMLFKEYVYIPSESSVLVRHARAWLASSAEKKKVVVINNPVGRPEAPLSMWI